LTSSAIECFVAAAALHKEMGRTRDEAACINLMGDAHKFLGNFADAAQCQNTALSMSRRCADRVLESHCLEGLGQIHKYSGRFRDALQYFEEALAIVRDLDKERDECALLGECGDVYYRLGDFDRAIQHASIALESSRKLGERGNESQWLMNLGNAHSSLGRFPEAQECYLNALMISLEIGDKHTEAALKGNLGTLHGRMGFVENALDETRQALEICRELGDKRGEAAQLCNLAIYLGATGKKQEALDHYRAAANIATEIDDLHCAAISLGNMGRLYKDLGDYESALTHLTDAWRVYELCGSSLGTYNVHLTSATVYEEGFGDLGAAHARYSAAISEIEMVRGGLSEDEAKVGFLGDKGDAYERMVLLCHKMGRIAEAFEFVERAKSRALLDLLADTKIEFRAADIPGAASLLKEESRIRHRMRAAQQNAKNRDAGVETLETVRAYQERLQQVYDALEPLDPEYVSLRRGSVISHEGVADLLARGREKIAVLEYFVTENRLLVFVLRGDASEPCLASCEVSHKRLAWLIENFRREVVNADELGDLGQTWQDLGGLLVEPVIDLVGDADILCVVPHRELHYVPFHALRSRGKCLLENWAIVYCPSASVLPHCLAKRKCSKDTCVAFGVEFEEEAESVARFFDGEVHVGKGVSRVLVRDRAPEHDVVHFSCHGTFDTENAMDSGLELGSWEMMTARDILSLRLDADLVVLSACETGKSARKPGDELIGLTRSLFYAGAPSLLVSLWPVESQATELLMSAFYRRYKGGCLSKARALQEAQLEVMGLADYAHPRYWAPFVLVGDWQ